MEMVSQPLLQIFQFLFAPISRHAKYFLKQEKYVRAVGKCMTKIVAKQEDLKAKLAAAKRNGKVPSSTIQEWYNKYFEIQKDYNKIKNMEQIMRQSSCFNFKACYLKYKVGKEAAEFGKEAKQFALEMPLGNIANSPPPERVMELATTTVITQPSAQVLLQNLLDWVTDEQIDAANIIGIYGVGGVGKTTLVENLNNQLKKSSHAFGTIIMVKVSQKVDKQQIQKNISDRLGIHLLPGYMDMTERLRSVLSDVKYLLILDNLWERLDLSDVGIPAPRNGSKILFTTRSLEVCVAMKADRNMEVTCLPLEEAWDLFLHETGPHVNNPTIKCRAKLLLERCGGLPLAIVTVARDMAVKERVEEWEDAIRELNQTTDKFQGMVESVFIPLKLSYDKLKDEIHRSCFLLCSLLPDLYEDYHREIIERCLLGEGLLDGVGNIQQSRNKVIAVIESLKRACLVQKNEYLGGVVTMHDMVRELALWISRIERHKINLRKVPQYSWEWKDDERISLMHCGLETFPPHLFPECPKLVTLLLGWNSRLEYIPDRFFLNMHALRVLDLSDTGIKSIPPSFSCLINLRVLLLHGCGMLTDMPSIGHLQQLQVLDLSFTALKELPSSIGLLSNLQSLHIYGQEMRTRPGLFSSLSNLEELSMNHTDGHDTSALEPMKELACFSKLNLRIDVSGSSIFLDGELCFLAKFMKKLVIYHCQGLKYIPKPWICAFEALESLEISYSEFENLAIIDELQTFGSLKKLCLGHLSSFQSICNGVIPTDCFASLEYLQVRYCHGLYALLDGGMAQQLVSLQSMEVSHCHGLVKLFGDEEVVEKDQTLFYLRRMQLKMLSSLKILGSCCWSSLEYLSMICCRHAICELPPVLLNSKNLREIEIDADSCNMIDLQSLGWIECGNSWMGSLGKTNIYKRAEISS